MDAKEIMHDRELKLAELKEKREKLKLEANLIREEAAPLEKRVKDSINKRILLIRESKDISEVEKDIDDLELEEEKLKSKINSLNEKWYALMSEISSISEEQKALLDKKLNKYLADEIQGGSVINDTNNETDYKKMWDNFLGVIGLVLGLVIIIFVCVIFIRGCTDSPSSGGSSGNTIIICINPTSGRETTLGLNRDGDRVISTGGGSASGLRNTNLSYARVNMSEAGYICR